ncbi:MAG: methyl-accepting chemotaxis protein, partial [Alicyclobacillus sp.]|nr:methyl-accepting chemotaxis protein [Alicyclobacillus sp.]
DWGWNVAAGSYMVDFNAPANQVLRMLMIALGIEVILGVVVSLWFAHRISKPVARMAQQVESVADGDLRHEPVVKSGYDEISRLARGFSTMTSRLRDLIKNISETSEQLAASAEQLAASADENTRATEQVTQTAQEVAAGAEKQAKTVEESSSTVTEMALAMEQIANKAQVASTSAGEADELSKSGNQSIRHVREQMDSIQKTVNTLSVVVKGLGERSNEIGHIARVITDISNQTDLLALNAAIEAARAGDSGRGFAVVAEEVRKLAEHSSASAKQIAALIEKIQEESNVAVRSMEDSRTEVAAGLEAVKHAGQSFAQIERAVRVVVEQVSEVSKAAKHLSADAEKLRTAMRDVEEVTESTSAGMQTVSASTQEQLASMEEISASAQSLSQHAEKLQHIVSQFKV